MVARTAIDAESRRRLEEVRRAQPGGEARTAVTPGPGPTMRSAPAAPKAPRVGGLAPTRSAGMTADPEKQAQAAAPAVATLGKPPDAIQPVSGRPGRRALPGLSGRLNKLLEEDSPYVRRARTRAAEHASSRGLLNSSIAAGAGEAAAIDAALPIAQGDANLALAERGLESQEFMQGRSIESTERIAAAQRDLQDLINRRNIRSQELMQERGLSHDAAQRQAQREMQTSIAAAERALRSEIAAGQRASEAATRETSRSIAQQQAVSRAHSVYQAGVDRINANPDIPAQERADMLSDLERNRDTALSLAQQIGGQRIQWNSYDQPAEPDGGEGGDGSGAGGGGEGDGGP